MSIPRLTQDATALFVIDVQGALMPTLADRERLTANCAALLRMAVVLGLPTVVTEHYVKGLGPSVPEVAACFPGDDPARFALVEKTRFSAYVPGVAEALRRFERPNVLVCGIEAHVCVLQAVLDLQDAGYRAFFATDAISAGQRDQIEPAFRRMEAAGAVPTGVVSAMYELMEDARHPRFKDCLDIAKQVHFERPR